MQRKEGNSYIYDYIKNLLANKTNLVLVLSLFFSSIIAFIFLVPHFTHPKMSYHILIHLFSLDIATFLTTISLISYRKLKSKKLLLTSFSFALLLMIEIFYLLQASQAIQIIYIPFIEVDFSHILLMCMLVLFACGVLRSDKK